MTAPDLPVPPATPTPTPPPMPTPATTSRRILWRVLRVMLVLFLLLGLLLAALVYYWAGTNQGSQQILSWVVGQQKMVHYQYVSGNVRDGLQLKNLHIDTHAIDIDVKSATLKLGWRAILQKEVHFRQAELDGFTLTKNTPPNPNPFDFKPIKLPVTLRFDRAVVRNFVIKTTPSSQVVFPQIILNEAVWSGDTIRLNGSSLQIAGIEAKNIRGSMQFKDKWPLKVHTDLHVPALINMKLAPIQLSSDGDLDALQVSGLLQWPDTAKAEVLLHPMRAGVPYAGQLNWADFDWPFAKQLALYSAAGQATVEGTLSGLYAEVNTDLTAKIGTKEVPKGQYRAQGFTNFRTLNLHRLQADVWGGQAVLAGELGWTEGVHWSLTGNSQKLPLQTILPPALAPYVPAQLNARLASVGKLSAKHSQIGAWLQQDQQKNQDKNQGEKWVVGVGRLAELSDSTRPMVIDAQWRNLKRATLPAIGALHSPQGHAQVQLAAAQPTRIDADLQLLAGSPQPMATAKASKTTTASATPAGAGVHLPTGRYQANLLLSHHKIDLPRLAYNGVAGDLAAQAQIDLPHAVTAPTAQKRKQPASAQPAKPQTSPLKWNAQLSTNGLKLGEIVAASPLQTINGSLKAHGESGDTQHMIWLDRADLVSQLNAEPVNSSTAQIAAQTTTQTAKTTSKTAVQSRTTQAVRASGRRVALQGSGQALLLMQAKANPAKSSNSATSSSTTKNSATSKAAASQTGSAQSLKSFDVRFNGKLSSQGVPNGVLNAHVAGTPQYLRIHQLTHKGDAGQADIRGDIHLIDGAVWQLSGAFDHFNPEFFAPDWKGDLSGTLNTTGRWQSDARQIVLSPIQLKGQLRQQPIRANGRLNVAFTPPKSTALAKIQPISWLPERFEAQDLHLVWGGNQLTANGNKQQMHLLVDAPALQQIHPDLSGRVAGQVDLTGQLQAPDARVDLSVNGLKFKQMSLAQGQLRGQLLQLGRQPSQLLLELKDFKQGTQQIEQAALQFAGTQQAHVLKAEVSSKGNQLALQLAGGLQANQDWLGQLQQGKLNNKLMSINQLESAALRWNQAAQQLSLSPHCWAGGSSRLCLTEPLNASSQQGRVALALNDLELSAFANFMPTGMVWVGKLNGAGVASWQQGQPPQLDATLFTDNGNIGLTAEDPQDPPLTLPYQRLSLLAKTQAEGIKIRFDAKTPSIGTGYIDAIIDPKPEQKTINGALVLDNVQINVFQPFFPAMRVLSGVASLAGGMSGPLTNPDFYGEFKLDEGRVVLAGAPVNLNKIKLRSSIRGTQASLNGEFYSGDGKGVLTGQAVWVNAPQINLNISGEELLIRQPPQLTARVSPDIDLQILPQNKYISVNGRILIPSALIAPTPSDDSGVAVSSDVRVVDRRLQQNGLDPALKAARPWRIDADMDVILGKAVAFRGFGANAPLNGTLRLRQRGIEGLSAIGDIGIARSVRVEAFGQSLLLRRGTARFNGSLTAPVLDIEATKSVEGRTVGVRVGGRLANPGVVIFNDAGLTEQEALNALLTGRISANNTVTNTAGFKSEVNNTLAAAGLSFGLSGSRSFTNKIGRSVGLSGLTVDAEGVGDDTQLNVTGYLSPDLYLRYGVGVFTPVNKLTLRYQINRRLYVEASSALEKAVDVFYNWRF